MSRQVVKGEEFLEWKRVTISAVATVVTGKTPPTADRSNYNGKIPFVSPADLGLKKYIRHAQKTLSTKGSKLSSVIPVGSILFTCIGSTIGKIGIATIPLRTNQQINSVIPKHIDGEYLYYLLSFMASAIKKLAGVQAVPMINKTEFENQIIKIPNCRDTQKAIASLLGKWDTAIEKTEALIAAQEKRFKWLLKTLISDQQGNPEWRRVKLEEIGVISSAGVDKKTIEGQEPVRLINYLDVLKKDFLSSDDLNHWVSAQERKLTQCNIKKGDVFFTPSSEIQGDIAHSAVALEDIKKAVYSYHVVRFRLKENWDLLFRGYVFKSSNFYHQAYRLCEGSGQRYVISQNYFRNMTIAFPNMGKQKQIAQILRTAQKEIDLLQRLAEQYRTQKLGLMQKLLTGEWGMRTQKEIRL